MNYENRIPHDKIEWDNPIRHIMRAVCNLPDRPYDPDDPELMLIGYDELLDILKEHLSGGPARG